MLTSSIEPTEVELTGVSSGTGLRQRRGKSAAASAEDEEDEEEKKEHTSFLPSSSTSVRPSSSTSAAVLPSTSAASAGPLTASAAAPVGELIRLDEPGLNAIFEKNNKSVPNNVSAKFTYFTVGEGSRYSKAPPVYLKSDQIIEYNLLQKTPEQRETEYIFLEKQRLVLGYNLDKLKPEYEIQRKEYLKPGLFTRLSRLSLQSELNRQQLAEEEMSTGNPTLYALKMRIERYENLLIQVEANMFVHETIRAGKTVSGVYKTRFGIEGGRRTIRRKRSKPAKTYKKHGSYRRRHGKTKTRRS